MKQTIDLHDFRDAFYKMGRKDNFSYEGLEVLFDYLEEFEQATGEEMELDVISLCGEFAESTIDDLISEYDIDISDCDPDDEEAIEETVKEYLEQNTTVCGVTSEGTVVYPVF
jgi:alpha-amylase/alpha-mannosidase (GH57 family)